MKTGRKVEAAGTLLIVVSMLASMVAFTMEQAAAVGACAVGFIVGLVVFVVGRFLD